MTLVCIRCDSQPWEAYIPLIGSESDEMRLQMRCNCHPKFPPLTRPEPEDEDLITQSQLGLAE